MQQKVWSLVRYKSPSKAQSQCVGIKHFFCGSNCIGGKTGNHSLTFKSFPDKTNEPISRLVPELPQFFIGNLRNMRFMVRKLPSPTIFSTGLRPKFIGIFGIPTRHMDPIGHMAYGNFGYRPTWKKLAKEISAHLAMQAANTVHGTTTTNGEIGHIKTLPSIIGICPT